MCESVCSWRDATALVGVDAHDDVAGQLDLVAEQVPHHVVAVDLDAGDLDHAAVVLEPAGVADLPATAGMERRAVELHAARRGVDDHGAVLVEVGLLVAEVDGHGSRTYPWAARPRLAARAGVTPPRTTRRPAIHRDGQMRLLALSTVVLLAPATVPPPDDSSLHLSSGDDYTVLGALAELPASTRHRRLDDPDRRPGRGDRVGGAASDRREPDVDAVASWIFPLTGLPRDDSRSGRCSCRWVGCSTTRTSASIAEFDAALGWSLVDADAFVEQSTPPESFAVITGDFDETTLSPDLAEVADGVVSYGEGEDFDDQPDQPSQPRRSASGRPVRLAEDGDRHRRVVQHPVRAGVARRARRDARRRRGTRQPWPRRSMKPTSSPPS